MSLHSGNNIRFLKLLGLLFLISTTMHTSDSDLASSLRTLKLDGHLSFHDVFHAARDFGNRFQFLPLAILSPGSVSDISTMVKHIYHLGSPSKLTIAARGSGHSLQGQAQAPGGVVVEVEALKEVETGVHATGEVPYVDVSGGELWINVLHQSLEHGLSPKSWTDYLHLTVGGTLSNAGISGQAFRHGPQISNVQQLEIVTGKGEVVNCSEQQNADLFHGVLGGLGQFGIITRARIVLERAPKMVKWIRVLYSNFSIFSEDQELLISAQNTFDYIEGFVSINRANLLNNWRSSFIPEDPYQASQFDTGGRTLFCLEMAKNFNPEDTDCMNQEVNKLLSWLRYIPFTLFQKEVTYLEFLDRVHISEMKLRTKGLWEVPHPWLNLFIPRSRIHEFSEEVFGNILTDSSNGPILLYPLNKSKWDNRTSVVLPDDEVFYLVAFLSSASSPDSLDRALKQNERITDFCKKAGINMKQYLPHYTSLEEWKAHFGTRWEVFAQRKSVYDPLAILAPGQKIFKKATSFS